MTVSEIHDLLAQAGLQAVAREADGPTAWDLAVAVDQATSYVTVIFPTRRGNLLVASKLDSPRLDGQNLDRIPAETLRTLLRLQSAGGGPSVTYLPDGTFVVGLVVHGSVVISSSELRLIIMETATLAVQIDTALS